MFLPLWKFIVAGGAQAQACQNQFKAFRAFLNRGFPAAFACFYMVNGDPVDRAMAFNVATIIQYQAVSFASLRADAQTPA